MAWETMQGGFGESGQPLAVSVFQHPANPDYPGDQWHAGLARMTVACRAYGLRAIDGPFGDFKDPDGFMLAARRDAALGLRPAGDPALARRLQSDTGLRTAARRSGVERQHSVSKGLERCLGFKRALNLKRIGVARQLRK